MKKFKTALSTISMLLLFLMLWSMPALAQTSDSNSLNGYVRPPQRPPRRPHRPYSAYTVQFDKDSVNLDCLSTDILEKVSF